MEEKKEDKQPKKRVTMREQEPLVRARNFMEVPCGYTPEEEETPESADDGGLEPHDFSVMSRKELANWATTLELAFNSRTSEERLRLMVEEAYTNAMLATLEE